MSLTTSARLVRAIMAVACTAAIVVVGAVPAAAAPKKSAKAARTYTVNQGPCTIDKMPKGTSHQWTRAGESIVHRVRYGEGLQQIAIKYGFKGDDAYRKLWDANPQLKETWLSSAGITVRVPACGTELTERRLPKPPPPPEPEEEVETEEAETTEADDAVESTDTDTGSSSDGGGDGGGSDQAAASTPAPESAPSVPSGSVWDALAQCESGGNWSINTGNGYYGGLQFSASSWAAVGGSGLPHQHSREEQIKRAEILQSQQGWGAWPSCSAKLGLG
jgi:hypothetical protein